MSNDPVEEYKKIRPSYEAFTNKIEDLLISLFKGEEINFHLIEKRTKTIESFSDKINRKKEQYSNPLTEITDLSGVRAILYYTDDIDKVDKIIRDNFLVDENNTLDKRRILKDDQFGYQSLHYVVSLNNDRNNLAEWRMYKTCKTEIQVRTVLQHAWASISHELEYKRESEIPSMLRRRLFRLAGLIELADEEFKEVRDRNSKLEIAIANKLEVDNVKVYEELNLATLKQYFSDTDNSVLSKLRQSAIKSGFTIDSDISIKSSVKDVLELTKIIGIQDINSLDSFLNSKIALSEDYLKNIFKSSKTDQPWYVETSFIVVLFLLNFLSKEDVKKYNHSDWGDDIWAETLKGISMNKKSG